MEIHPIAAFADNYIWLLRNTDDDAVTAVDPGDANPVLDYLRREGLVLGAILVTHHHADHTGGIRALKSAFPEAQVYGPVREAVQGLTQSVGEGATVSVGNGEISFEVLDVPGHTAGHVAYFGAGVLFCGDTLFAAGCGRVFEGTMQQMSDSLQRIAQLPSDTLAYCAHEYTLSNLGFARLVEPENEAIRQREANTKALRTAKQPSVPSLLSLELETNPFLRTQIPEVVEAAEHWAGRSLGANADVFAALRNWKDRGYD